MRPYVRPRIEPVSRLVEENLTLLASKHLPSMSSFVNFKRGYTLHLGENDYLNLYGTI